MNIITQCALVGLGGFLGSIARYLVLISVNGFSFFGSHGLATVNISGSFLTGLLLPWIAGNDQWRLLIAVGFLGSLTTMSAFSISGVEMLKDEKLASGIGFLLSHTLFCITACALGLAIGVRLKV